MFHRGHPKVSTVRLFAQEEMSRELQLPVVLLAVLPTPFHSSGGNR